MYKAAVEHSFAAALGAALAYRARWVDPARRSAFRAFAGIHEGERRLTIDVYGPAAVLHDHGEPNPESAHQRLGPAVEQLVATWPWLEVVICKPRRSPVADRGGRPIWGNAAAIPRSIEEEGLRYAIDLTLGRDAGFYLDTRLLRRFLRATLAGGSFLNLFAHTGSLGVAARAAPAARVVQVDRSRAYLSVARQSWQLNGWSPATGQFLAADFFAVTHKLRREQSLFDALVIDPPPAASGARGRIDQLHDGLRLIDKVRPLIGDGGLLISINNALYLSGSAWEAQLRELTGAGYLHFEQRIDVPDDLIGSRGLARASLPADPAPFNHPTKIAVLRVRRKDGRCASPVAR